LQARRRRLAGLGLFVLVMGLACAKPKMEIRKEMMGLVLFTSPLGGKISFLGLVNRPSVARLARPIALFSR